MRIELFDILFLQECRGEGERREACLRIVGVVHRREEVLFFLFFFLKK